MPDSPDDAVVMHLPVRVIGHYPYAGWVGEFPAPPEYSAGSLEDALAALPTTVAAPAYDRDAVLAQIEELTNPRKQFVARAVAAMEAIVGPEPDPAAGVEAWLKRELAVSYARHMAEFDADMIFGVGRDGRDAGSQLRGLLVEPNGDPALFADDPELVRCAGCGMRGRWEGAVVVNAEGRAVPRWCSAPARYPSKVTVGRLRAHGPWMP